MSAPYIQGALSEEDLDEMNIEIIRNTLYKAYLEDFYQYCLDLGGETATFMGEILQVTKEMKREEGIKRESNIIFQFEADRRSINITINSFGTDLAKDDREKLYPDFGLLYPEGTSRMAKVDDIEQVKTIVSQYAVPSPPFHLSILSLLRASFHFSPTLP
jgi:V-type H+-transporting ATPase subunit d